MNTTEQNNILISEFLGMQKTNLGWFDNEEEFLNIERDNTFDNLKFHYDWNWLMLVVSKIEKIEDNEFTVAIDLTDCAIYGFGDFKDLSIKYYNKPTKIEAVYSACIEFINWYNENLTSQI